MLSHDLTKLIVLEIIETYWNVNRESNYCA